MFIIRPNEESWQLRERSFLVENVFKELFTRAEKRAETGENKGLLSQTIFWMPVAGQ
jgi:hypothetical protein